MEQKKIIEAMRHMVNGLYEHKYISAEHKNTLTESLNAGDLTACLKIRKHLLEIIKHVKN